MIIIKQTYKITVLDNSCIIYRGEPWELYCQNSVVCLSLKFEGVTYRLCSLAAKLTDRKILCSLLLFQYGKVSYTMQQIHSRSLENIVTLVPLSKQATLEGEK